jgi:hypothetical protein
MKKKFFLTLSVSLIVFVSVLGASAQSCKFEKDKEGMPPLGGANETVVLRARTVRKIRGAVIFNYRKEEKAVVAVYRVAGNDRILAGWQRVDSEARFCFGKLPAGRYILEAGAGSGINITQVEIFVDPDNLKASEKKIEISLELGT